MAEFKELQGLLADSDLHEKTMGAVLVAASTIVANGAATAREKAWARAAFSNPSSTATLMLPAVLGENSSAPVSAIQAATDSTILTAVNNALSVFAV